MSFSRLILSYLVVVWLLPGCGNDSTTSSTTSSTINNAITNTSKIEFHLPSGISVSGIISSYDINGQLLSSVTTDNVETASIELRSSQRVRFIFEPSATSVSCMLTKGCGSFSGSNSLDVNANGKIDQGEFFPLNILFEAEINILPGVNTVYFSPLANVEVETQLLSHHATMTLLPIYHTLNSNSNQQDIASYFTNALFVALVGLRSETGNANINNQVIEDWKTYYHQFTQSELLSHFFQLAEQYLEEQTLLAGQSSHQLSAIAVAHQYLLQLASLSSDSLKPPTSVPPNIENFLTQFRDLQGFIQFQQQLEHQTVINQISDISSLFNQDTQNLFNVLASTLGDTLSRYSPLSDQPAGEYQQNELTITYSTNPYHWVINGLSNNVDMQIELTVPTWRVSATNGDFAEGQISAVLHQGDSLLQINSEILNIKFDGIEDVFTQNKAETAKFNFVTDILLQNQLAQFTGALGIRLDRVKDAQEQLIDRMTNLSLKGMTSYNNDQQNVLFDIMPLSPIGELDDYLLNSTVLIPATGGRDLKIQFDSEFSKDKALMIVRLKQQLISLAITQTTSGFSALVANEHGYQLKLDKKGKSYSGAIYLGQQQINPIVMVKSVPGIILSDGTFESLF
jgi:hypothetical protein